MSATGNRLNFTMLNLSAPDDTARRVSLIASGGRLSADPIQTHFYQLHRAAEFDHAYVDEAVYPIDERLQQEVRQPEGGRCSSLRILQLRSHSSNDPCRPGGSRDIFRFGPQACAR